MSFLRGALTLVLFCYTLSLSYHTMSMKSYGKVNLSRNKGNWLRN